MAECTAKGAKQEDTCTITLGNGMNMRAIFNEDNLMNFWMLAKKKISPCSDCGLKYACTDCRGLDYKIGGKLEVNLFCPFGEERNVQ